MSRGTPLVLVAHGSRSDLADAVTRALAHAVAQTLGVPVRLGYVGVRGPTVADAVAGLGRGVVVPAFLASGHHVRADLPAQLAACGADPVRFPVAPALGPDPRLARAAADRLAQAGWRRGDAVVLAAAGSSDPAAVAEVRSAGRALHLTAARRVRVGFAASTTPRVAAVVAGLRAAGEGRIAVASWLLAPGMFHDRVADAGADVVAAPLGAHPGVVDVVVRRYLTALSRADVAA